MYTIDARIRVWNQHQCSYVCVCVFLSCMHIKIHIYVCGIDGGRAARPSYSHTQSPVMTESSKYSRNFSSRSSRTLFSKFRSLSMRSSVSLASCDDAERAGDT